MNIFINIINSNKNACPNCTYTGTISFCDKTINKTFIDENNFGYPFIGGKRKYARILIQKVK